MWEVYRPGGTVWQLKFQEGVQSVKVQGPLLYILIQDPLTVRFGYLRTSS